MSHTLVRYRAKPERAQENQALIENVFRELRASAPDGLRYLVLRLQDDSFVHLVVTDAEENRRSLQQTDAFQAFQSDASDRYAERPQANDATIVGNYRMLEEWRDE